MMSMRLRGCWELFCNKGESLSLTFINQLSYNGNSAVVWEKEIGIGDMSHKIDKINR